jgi:peptidoglycan/xylan/chitin deacetylase (PgdA/CDA1 family)
MTNVLNVVVKLGMPADVFIVPYVVGAFADKEESVVDFNKLRDPEYKKRIAEDRKQREAELDQKDKANIFMAAKLHELVENDKITDTFDVGFVNSVYSRTRAGIPLTDKQVAYLEKCFNDKH